LSILSAHSVGKNYDGRTVLQGVSFEIYKGEVCALIGRSGSGKTTLIRILAGLLAPDTGEVWLEGEKLENPDDQLVPGYEEIRLVHQDFQLKHRMTVRENIRYELLSYVSDYQHERISELLKLCRIEHLQDKDISLLSGGEKQRVAIARGMATEPDVLLLDEPFSNLDINTKAILLEEVKEIASSTDTAIFLITHDARDAMEIADRLLVLDAGQLIKTGTPENIYHAPDDTRVADLLGLYNTLTVGELQTLLPNISPPAGHHFGLWAEDLQLDPGGFEATIQKVVFGGPYNKVVLSPHSLPHLRLWAFDHTKKITPTTQVCFSIKGDRLFPVT